MIGATTCEPWSPIWCGELPVGSEAVSGTMVQAASDALWALSGRQYGLCTVTLRPCRRECSEDVWGVFPGGPWWQWGTWPRPVFFNGAWLNITCGGCAGSCSCTVLSETLLPAPVHAITEVKLDGVAMPVTGAYRLDNNRILLRTDGEMWPICQDLNKADTEVDTWSVTAQYGQEVPTLGRLAVGELAMEFINACLGEDCKLPQPIQSLARQGVEISFLDPAGVFADGKIGLYNSDLFIQTTNPSGLKSRSRVYDVDNPSVRRAGS